MPDGINQFPQEKQPGGFGISEPNRNNFDKIANKFNQITCEQNVNMLVISSADLLGYLQVIEDEPLNNPISEVSEINKTYDKALAGFFISPRNENLEVNGNKLTFQAVWTEQNNSIYKQYFGIPSTPQLFTHFTHIARSNNDLAPFVEYEPMTPEFNHKIFQFNDDAVVNQFGKCFISWYELKSILEYSKFIGFAGSLVLTGNFGVTEPLRDARMHGRCNTAYFTYRVVGFNKFTVERSTSLINGKIKLDENKEYLLRSDLMVKDGELQEDRNPEMIPAQTWASPCPPMWRPI